MTAPKKDGKIRVTPEAYRLASIASGYTGESMTQFVSRAIVEAARIEIERGHAALMDEPKPKRPRPKGGE